MNNTVDCDEVSGFSEVQEASASPIDAVAVRRMANHLVSSAWFSREINRLSGSGYSLAQIATIITGSAAGAFAAGIQHRVLLSVVESTQDTEDIENHLSAVSGEIHDSTDEIVDKSGLYDDETVDDDQGDQETNSHRVPVFAGETQGAAAVVPSRVSAGQFRDTYVVKGRSSDSVEKEVILEDESRSYRSVGRPQSHSRAGEASAPSVSAGVIRELLIKLMNDHHIERLSLNEHGELVDRVFDKVPELAELPYHARNRKIIDAVAGRKYGPVLGSENGRRFIYLA